MSERIRAQRFLRNEVVKQHESEQELIHAAAYEKALDAEVDEVNPISFIDLYGMDEVEDDVDHVVSLRKEFTKTDREKEKEIRERAFIFESLVIEQIELNEWFGSEVETRRAADYDDIENGIDLFVEFHDESGADYLGGAIDVTQGGWSPQKAKFARIMREMREGKLGQAKYFESKDGSIKGEIKKLPRMVLAMSPEGIKELSKLWVEGAQRELAVHPAQIILLRQTIEQLQLHMLVVKDEEVLRIINRQLHRLIKVHDEKLLYADGEELVRWASDEKHRILMELVNKEKLKADLRARGIDPQKYARKKMRQARQAK